NFKEQIQEKSIFPISNRAVLVESISRQYTQFNTSELTKQNIKLLAQENTFTITTGHQLNLFTGHLYFLYKIISVIKLTKELKINNPTYNFVPVFWMATEDHDFEEINHFHLHGKTISWNREASGAVGQLDLEGLEEVYKAFS